MTRLAMRDLGPEYDRIFGVKDEAASGRSRLCRVCHGWHRADEPWPHNCRSDAPPRNQQLAAPQIAPKFEAFRTGVMDGAEAIGDPKAKREFMERKDLVEYEPIAPPPAESDRAWKKTLVEDFKRAIETDQLSAPPLDIIGRSDLDGADEIDVNKIEVFK